MRVRGVGLGWGRVNCLYFITGFRTELPTYLLMARACNIIRLNGAADTLLCL